MDAVDPKAILDDWLKRFELMSSQMPSGRPRPGAGVLASESSQDIWGQASRYASQHHATLGVTNGGRGGLAGYTELCESIAEFKRDSVRRHKAPAARIGLREAH
jgi:hypothetical protein